MDRREKNLIQRLLKPMDGERLLDVGCGEGNCLRFFRGRGCSVTGTDPSQHMLDMARETLGQRADLCPGDYEDLPFSDNEFDIVTLIFPDSSCNLQRAINEAIRVCSGRIFLGTINRYSPGSACTAKKATLDSYGDPLRSSIPGLIHLIRSALSDTTIKWGSVIFFPSGWYPAGSFFEERIPVMRNPFGSFIGLAFPVTYTHITVQNPLGEASKAKAAGEYLEPGAARRRTGK
ncbi:MAG: class I SAM-dependent methyltransferase [Deltaproteobacteria bacterium]|nr:class I SAM-dependent methyltransferase [Deltaproteobacteria bacterium]